MKRNGLLLLFMMLPCIALCKNLQAHLSHAAFYAPGQGPYIETYLSVSGKSVAFAPKAGKYQASIEVSIVLSQNDAIKYFDKYNLLSPEVDDTLKTSFNFLDQQRIPLPNGRYKFELSIKDKNVGDQPYTVVQEVNIDYHPNVIAFSDIEFLESFVQAAQETKLSKGGYELVPLVDNFFPESRNTLKFYSEVYNTSAVLGNDGFVLSYFIETYETHQVLNNFSRMQRMQSKEVNAVIKEIDIAELPSGNYNLVIEARNKTNELLASREIFFQRSKPLAISESSGSAARGDISNTFVAAYTDKDTLAEYIRSLRPISGNNDNLFADNQVEAGDLKMMQQFFYDFWERKNKDNPYQAWTEYKREVEKVNEKYGNQIKKGYATERGRVYLKYGPPNHIAERHHEPSYYPYEVWQYYKTGNQTSKKFVFFNPDLVTNEWILLHSDAIGEPNDPQWEKRVSQRTDINVDYDREDNRKHYGNRAKDTFRDPH
jgi:GWxTD domain-containing protein